MEFSFCKRVSRIFICTLICYNANSRISCMTIRNQFPFEIATVNSSPVHFFNFYFSRTYTVISFQPGFPQKCRQKSKTYNYANTINPHFHRAFPAYIQGRKGSDNSIRKDKIKQKLINPPENYAGYFHTQINPRLLQTCNIVG